MTLGNPLFSLLRDGFEEIRAYGELVAVDGDGVIFHTGEVMGQYPARSLLKPFQIFAAGLPAEKLASSGELRYTASLGSVSATAEQVAELQQWWKGSPAVDKLGVPPAYPMDENHRAQLRAAKQPPQRIFHTCFSKHLAIIEGCVGQGWNPEGYLSTSHPYHQRLKTVLGSYLGRSGFAFVTDGCLLPSPVLALSEMARLYRWVAAGGRDGELQSLRDRMLARPEWIGGPGRQDTLWMQANPGRMIAKEGADGLWGIGILPSASLPQGVGLVLKLASGFHPALASIAVSRFLESLGLAPACEVPKGQKAVFHYQPSGETAGWLDISPTVGESLAVFPGDVAYRRKVSLDTRKGDHLSLSSIEMTVHAGAHTDAPGHFESTGAGIDAVALEKYAGAAQVITVRKARGQRLVADDIAGIHIRAPRVLFKTGSFPDPRTFNLDFVTLSASLVESLHRAGVQLVGIDTPSIDPSDSKDLPAHHATTLAGMAILEGIVLDDIEDGLYELYALPLKLEGADASPVRAVLRPAL